MSVEFSNTYQEILLDNLVSIIKQNFIFQTQLKLAEGGNKDKAELQEKYDTLFSQYESLKSQTPELEALRLRVDTNAGAHEEKSRIQSALNDEMKRSAELKRTLEERDGEISNLKEQILKLESDISSLKEQTLKLEASVPFSKTKKVSPVIVPDLVEPTPLILSKTKVSDGSTF